MTSFFLSLFAGTFKDWWATRQESDKLKAVASVERSKSAMAGWSDEYLLFVWSLPFIMVFTPWHDIASRGFERLATLPDWYVGGFISISFAVFGIDKIFKWRGN